MSTAVVTIPGSFCYFSLQVLVESLTKTGILARSTFRLYLKRVNAEIRPLQSPLVSRLGEIAVVQLGHRITCIDLCLERKNGEARPCQGPNPKTGP
jgi:hypothetical protein